MTSFRARGVARTGLFPLSGALLLAATGCGDKPRTEECGYPKPAFALTVRTPTDEALPTGTMVMVIAGSGSEIIAPDALPASPKIAFCHLEMVEMVKSRLVCALWTDGAATVDVVAPGYKRAKKDYEAQTDDCGIATKDVELTLEKDDDPKSP